MYVMLLSYVFSYISITAQIPLKNHFLTIDFVFLELKGSESLLKKLLLLASLFLWC